MKGGVITGLWGDVFYIFADVFAANRLDSNGYIRGYIL